MRLRRSPLALGEHNNAGDSALRFGKPIAREEILTPLDVAIRVCPFFGSMEGPCRAQTLRPAPASPEATFVDLSRSDAGYGASFRITHDMLLIIHSGTKKLASSKGK